MARGILTGRNAPCWCGSRKKYKFCHLRRADEKPWPAGQLNAELAKRKEQGVCLHPDAGKGLCDSVIDAHSIPRASTLAPLTDTTRHVLTFLSWQTWLEDEPTPLNVGWRQASTFRGFCAKHDNDAFEPLEKQAFAATPQQCFLLAFRGLCYELFVKEWQLRCVSVLKDVIDRGRQPADQQAIQEYLRLWAKGIETGVRDIRLWKKKMDQALQHARFADWSHRVFSLRGQLHVAGTGLLTPEVGFDGSLLQSLRRLDKVMYPLAVSMIVSGEEIFHLVLTWPAEADVCRTYVETLIECARDRSLPDVLVRFLFASIENVYFSTDWWDALDERRREEVRALALQTKPDPTAVIGPEDSLVDWELVDVRQVDSADAA